MPYCDGLQLLQWTRENPLLRKIPFVIFSSSPLESDIATAHRLGAAGYFVKPKAISGYTDLMEELSVYWNPGGVPEL